MPRKHVIIPGVDKKLLIKDAAKLLCRSRRGGCCPARRHEPRRARRARQWLRHRRQRRRRRDHAAPDFQIQRSLPRRCCSNPNALAPEYPESAITRSRSRSKAAYNTARTRAPEVDGKTYKLEVSGLVENKEPWTLEKLYALPQVSCRSPATSASRAGARSAPGRECGSATFLKRIGADFHHDARNTSGSQCAEGYSNTIDMPTAAASADAADSFKFDNKILPRKYGFPMKCRIPTKLGFQRSEIHHRDVRAEQQRRRRLLGETRGYNWFRRAVQPVSVIPAERSGESLNPCDHD